MLDVRELELLGDDRVDATKGSLQFTGYGADLLCCSCYVTVSRYFTSRHYCRGQTISCTVLCAQPFRDHLVPTPLRDSRYTPTEAHLLLKSNSYLDESLLHNR